MKIGIDARIYKTGIGRYVKNLIRELAEVSQSEDQFIVFLRRDGFAEFEPPDERFKKILADYPPYSFAEQLLFLLQLWQAKVNFVHFTNFNVPILWPGKFVVTIHDLIHQSHSTFGSSTRNRIYYQIKKLVYGLVIRWVGFRAARVLVPSEATKRDVIESLGVNPEKVYVTYEGVEEKWRRVKNYESGIMGQNSLDNQAVLQKYGVERPYLLYVATMYPHKNHLKLIEAFELLVKDKPDLMLVLVGKVDYFSERLKKEVTKMGLSERVVFPNFACPDGYLPDQDLVVFYQNADVYVFPSLKEGFGIPILEAQAYGVPVVCSSWSCLPEIGGESVVYFNPDDAADIAAKTRRVLDNQELRADLINKGYQNLQRFSWQKMAQETYKIYQEI